MITITEVTIVLHRVEKLRAFASITIDDSFVVTGLKVIESDDGRLFTAMPSRKCANGKFQDIAHPISAEARTVLEDAVQSEYERMLRQERGGRPTNGTGPDLRQPSLP